MKLDDRVELLIYFFGTIIIVGLSLFVYYNGILMCKYDNESIMSAMEVSEIIKERGDAKAFLICDNFLTDIRVKEIIIERNNELANWQKRMLIEELWEDEKEKV